MTNNAILGTLKVQWVILKDTSASAEDRVAAYTMIDTLQKQMAKDDPTASVIDLTKTRYKVFASIDTAKSAPKVEQSPAPASKPSTSSYNGNNSGFVKIEKFAELSPQEVDAFKKKIIKAFEVKNLVEQVANEQFPYYANAPSIGQIVNLLLAE